MHRGIVHIEPRLGGRQFESYETDGETRIFEVGTVRMIGLWGADQLNSLRSITELSQLVGISGSLRRQSFNSALLRTARDCLPAGAVLEVCSIEAIPLYNGDDEASDGIPPPVAALKEKIAAADGLLIATPEYNNAMPGVLKNAIDWLTRPPGDVARVFHARPVALMGASPGQFGTTLSQTSWLPVLRTLRMRPWFEGRLMIPHAGAVFDAAGNLTDQKVLAQLRQFMQGFASFAGSSRPAS